jgi:hypothetical protein
VASFGAEVSRHLTACAAALRQRRPPSPLADVDSSTDGFMTEIAAMREDGDTRVLTTVQLEQLFGLGFAFEEIRRNLADLQRAVSDFA